MKYQNFLLLATILFGFLIFESCTKIIDQDLAETPDELLQVAPSSEGDNSPILEIEGSEAALVKYCQYNVVSAQNADGQSVGLKAGDIVCTPCASPCKDVTNYEVKNPAGTLLGWFTGTAAASACKKCANGVRIP